MKNEEIRAIETLIVSRIFAKLPDGVFLTSLKLSLAVGCLPTVEFQRIQSGVPFETFPVETLEYLGQPLVLKRLPSLTLGKPI